MADTIGNLNIKVGVDASPAEYGFKELANAMRHFVRAVDSAKPAGLKDTAAELKATAVAADGLTQRLQKIATVAAKPITVPVRLARGAAEAAGSKLKSWATALATPITVPVRLASMIAGEVKKAAIGPKDGAAEDPAVKAKSTVSRDTAHRLREIAKEADRAKLSVGGLGDKLKGLAGSALKGGVAGIAAGLTMGLGSAGLGGIGDVLGSSIDLAAKAEANAMAFEVMTGSAEKARDMIADIRTYAKESPFGTDGVTNATRGLVAFGLAADKAVPTVRMLGDVASASGDRAGETLDRLVLAYGQVYTANRLMGTELKQFTEAGVPLFDELAKVMKRPKAEIKSLVEQGQVGFADVARAFRGMVTAGGRFAGMTERYGESFLGTMDRLKDGVAELKREFGVALIEELGLKDAAKDGEKFAADMRKLVADLRPAIRFVGDLGKGVAQVLGEGIRNAPLFARAFGAALRKGSPELGSFADRAQDLIRDLQNFKLDPVKVIELAADIGVALGTAADFMIKRLKEGLAGIYQGEVKSIVDSLVSAATTWERIKSALDATLDLVDDLNNWQKRNELKAKGQLPTREDFVADRLKEDGFNDVVTRLQKQANRRWTLREAGDPDKREAVTRQQELLTKDLVDIERVRKFIADRRFEAEFGDSAKGRRDAREAIAESEQSLQRLLKDNTVPIFKLLGGTGELKLGGADLMRPGPVVKEFSFKDLAQDAKEAAREVADFFKKEQAERAEQDASRTGGSVFGMGFSKVGHLVAQSLKDTKKAADSLKVLADEPVALTNKPIPQLPPIIEVGTAEFARLAGEAMMPPMETAEDLLRQILGVNRDQLEATRAVTGGPVFVPNPSP